MTAWTVVAVALAAGRLSAEEPGPLVAPRIVRAGVAPMTDDRLTDPAGPARTKTITNIWIDTDIRQVVQDISAQTGVTIMADQTVQGPVSLAARDMPLEECLERLCAAGGFSFLRVKDYYVFGRADPGTAMFQKLADLRRVKLRHVSAEQVKALLPQSLSLYCTYDKTNGVLLVTAPAHLCQRVLDAIELIDVPSSQVAVEAIVFELTEEGSNRLGLDWQYSKGHFTVKGESLAGTITYDAASDMATFIDVTLRAIIQDEKGQVLANPRVLAMNGREAEIFVGQEKYFQLLNGSTANPYYRLESIKSGVTLKVTPYIGDSGQIILDLEPDVSDVVTDWRRDGNVATDPAANSALPVVTRRRAKTCVSIRDGQTVIIGGLLREQHRQLVEKVPVLGDWPGLGAAFRKVRDSREQKEIVILITTHLVHSARSADEAFAATALQKHYLSPLDAMANTRRGR